MTLTVVQVEEIQRLDRAAWRSRQIAETVGVSIRTVHEVLTGKVRGRPLTPREQAEVDRQAGWRAACMDDLEWVEWISKNSLAIPDGDAAARPCTDCPLGFAADMRAQGRCNGTPGGVAADPDEPEEEDTMDQPTPIGRRVTTEVALPCATCAHTEICRIRPALAELGRLAVALPVLDPAIGVELAATVSCSHYAKDRIRKADAGELEAKAKRTISPEGRAAMAAAAQARRARERAEREAVAS